MSKRLVEIAERKRVLIEKARRERAELATAYDKIRSPIEFSGTMLTLWRSVKSHPLVSAGISTFFVTGYAGKLLRSSGKVFKLWKVARPVWGWWKKRRRSK
ncbi:MAG TPA: hypothetical protein VGA27_09230 [Candidatus Binatia bacterium]